MSRIPALDVAAADAKVRPQLDAVHKALGVVPNLFKVTAQSPAALDALVGLNGALGHGTLGGKAREAIALAVAEANSCDYCLSAHTALGRMQGLGDGEIAAARNGEASEARLAAVVGFARALVDNRGHATDAQLARLREAGLTDGQVIEIVAHTVANIFTNYLNHVAGTDIDFPIVRAGAAKAA